LANSRNLVKKGKEKGRGKEAKGMRHTILVLIPTPLKKEREETRKREDGRWEMGRGQGV